MLKFFDKDWTHMGDKSHMASLVKDITRVGEAILRDSKNLDKTSVAQKMSWASSRKTTRPEDKAYSLIGLFGICMTTIYGEGNRAFIRLQEEIMRVSTDQTIFASQGNGEASGMLATSPEQFSESADYEPIKYSRLADQFGISVTTQKPDFCMTNFGLHIQLPIVKAQDHFQHPVFAILACHRGKKEEPAIIFLHQQSDKPSSHFYRTIFNGCSLGHANCRPSDSRPFWKSSINWKHVDTQTIWVSRSEESKRDKQLEIDHNQTRYEFCVTASKCLMDPADAVQIVDVYPEVFSVSEARLQASRGIETGQHGSVIFSSINQLDNQRLAFVFGIHDWHVWFDIIPFGFGGTAQSIAKEYDLFDLITRKSKSLKGMIFIGDLRQGQVLPPKATPSGYIVELRPAGVREERHGDKTEKYTLNLRKR
jgi:hypothetical protein